MSVPDWAMMVRSVRLSTVISALLWNLKTIIKKDLSANFDSLADQVPGNLENYKCGDLNKLLSAYVDIYKRFVDNIINKRYKDQPDTKDQILYLSES